MFAEATERALDYCRPIKTISRIYKADDICPKTATLFFINTEGAAITCRHVAEEIMRSGKMNAKYESFKKERNSIPEEANFRIETNRIERRYEYVKGETKVQLRYNFSRCFDKIERLGVELHPTFDIAVIRFGGFGTPYFHSNGIFPTGAVKLRPGMSVCCLGFPVVEFNDFRNVKELDDMQWTSTGNHLISPYPTSGMVSHMNRGEDGKVTTFYITGTYGDGYCGAPVYDRTGKLVGVVVGNATKVIDGNEVQFTECVNADIVRAFLREKNIKYFEE